MNVFQALHRCDRDECENDFGNHVEKHDRGKNEHHNRENLHGLLHVIVMTSVECVGHKDRDAVPVFERWCSSVDVRECSSVYSSDIPRASDVYSSDNP